MRHFFILSLSLTTSLPAEAALSRREFLQATGLVTGKIMLPVPVGLSLTKNVEASMSFSKPLVSEFSALLNRQIWPRSQDEALDTFLPNQLGKSVAMNDWYHDLRKTFKARIEAKSEPTAYPKEIWLEGLHSLVSDLAAEYNIQEHEAHLAMLSLINPVYLFKAVIKEEPLPNLEIAFSDAFFRTLLHRIGKTRPDVAILILCDLTDGVEENIYDYLGVNPVYVEAAKTLDVEGRLYYVFQDAFDERHDLKSLSTGSASDLDAKYASALEKLDIVSQKLGALPASHYKALLLQSILRVRAEILENAAQLTYRQELLHAYVKLTVEIPRFTKPISTPPKIEVEAIEDSEVNFKLPSSQLPKAIAAPCTDSLVAESITVYEPAHWPDQKP